MKNFHIKWRALGEKGGSDLKGGNEVTLLDNTCGYNLNVVSISCSRENSTCQLKYNA